jgi:replicative superfamily II helicase
MAAWVAACLSTISEDKRLLTFIELSKADIQEAANLYRSRADQARLQAVAGGHQSIHAKPQDRSSASCSQAPSWFHHVGQDDEGGT